jgi:hypothetical protein
MMFSEDLMRRYTLAVEQHEANEKRLARKKNRRGVWNKTENIQRHRKSFGLCSLRRIFSVFDTLSGEPGKHDIGYHGHFP